MRILSDSLKKTLEIGKKISGRLEKGDIICLSGELGSGKTVLTKGIASGLGIKAQDITSPTFVLIREYHKARIPLYHFDLYRLKSENELLVLGYEEYFYNDGVSVIEWADRLKCILPKDCLKIKLSAKGKNRRLLEINACGRHYQKLAERIYENISD